MLQTANVQAFYHCTISTSRSYLLTQIFPILACILKYHTVYSLITFKRQFNLRTNNILQVKGLKYANSSFNQKPEFKETLKISSN